MYYIYIIFESKMCFSKFSKKFYKSKSIICHLKRLFQCLLKADNSQQFLSTSYTSPSVSFNTLSDGNISASLNAICDSISNLYPINLLVFNRLISA